MDEDRLVEQLGDVERRFGDVGEEAARAALARWREREGDTEFQVSVPSPTAQLVLVGWCRRYGLTPYRKPKQRKASVCVRAPRGFMHEVMWPRVEAMARLVETETANAVTRVVERWSGARLEREEETADQGELFTRK